MRGRGPVFYLHLVVGVAVGLLLTSAGLTGSVLVWRAELDALLNPHLLRVRPAAEAVPLQAVVDAARAAAPGASPLRVRLARAPHETHEVTTDGADPRQIYVDPYRGTVLGSRGATETFTNWLFEWHTKLLSGKTGERVMGTAGLLLLILVLTGVWVWWPGLRRLRDGLVVRWRAGWKRVNFDLHRAVGIWSTAFLTMVAVTGSSLEFKQEYMTGLNRLTASPPRPAPPTAEPRPNLPPLPLDALVRAGDRALPGGEITWLTLPARPGDALVVRKRMPDELHPNGRNFVYLHPQTGELLALEEAGRAPAGTRAYNVLYPIHIGRWGGIPSRLLYTLLGLTPALLFVSGCLMWWNRSGRRKLTGGRRARAARPRRAPQAREAA